MKKLTIAASLIFSLFTSQVVLADETQSVSVNENIETIVVVAKSNSLDFEIFSLRKAEEALDEAMQVMVESFAVAEETAGLIDFAINAGS